MQGPRFSGLQGESLSTAVRWERDVVRLERASLQQKNSRQGSCSKNKDSQSAVHTFDGPLL